MSEAQGKSTWAPESSWTPPGTSPSHSLLPCTWLPCSLWRVGTVEGEDCKVFLAEYIQASRWTCSSTALFQRHSKQHRYIVHGGQSPALNVIKHYWRWTKGVKIVVGARGCQADHVTGDLVRFHLILHVLLKLANHLHIGGHLLLGIFLHRLAGHPQQFTASRVFIL